MVDRKDVGSWLGGPPAARDADGSRYPGQRLGMPRKGAGSVARFGRRLVAIAIDWWMCQLLAYAFFHVTVGRGGSGGFAALGIFALENLLLVGTLGCTVGHRLLGLGVMSLDGGRANPVQVLLRTVLLCLAVPALVWDRDGRGLHDKAAGTVLVRTS